MSDKRLSIFKFVLVGAFGLFLFGCSKKDPVVAPVKTVLTGYYSLVGLYSINANGTYTPKVAGSCLQDFSLNLKDNNLMQFQDACQNFTGTWSYVNNTLTITESSGSVDIKGPVEFEADGITIDLNNTIDNTRYQLFRN